MINPSLFTITYQETLQKTFPVKIRSMIPGLRNSQNNKRYEITFRGTSDVKFFRVEPGKKSAKI